MRKRITTIILVVILLTGLSLLLYPTVSNAWISYLQSKAMAEYTEAVANNDDTDNERLWSEAVSYNESLSGSGIRWEMTGEEEEAYNQLLNIGSSGIMSYIEIPKINCSLPICHGVDEQSLKTAVGHLAGTSLPVGGQGSHCVLSGHRGLPSARLFTDLDKLEEGDVFRIQTLDRVLTYEVDQIQVVEPSDLTKLKIIDGMDYCTLVTCTPYGINTHRLLVRGRRVETEEAAEELTPVEEVRLNPIVTVPIVAVPAVLVLLIVLLICTKRRKTQRHGERTERELEAK